MTFIILLFSVIIATLDQLIKYQLMNYITFQNQVELIPGILDLVYWQNQGAAFGILQGHKLLLVVCTAIILGLMVYILFKKKPVNKWFNTAMSLVIGGALGNIADRIFRGYVIDYLKLKFFAPAFNLADVCITLGTVILLIYVMFFYNMPNKD